MCVCVRVFAEADDTVLEGTKKKRARRNWPRSEVPNRAKHPRTTARDGFARGRRWSSGAGAAGVRGSSARFPSNLERASAGLCVPLEKKAERCLFSREEWFPIRINVPYSFFFLGGLVKYATQTTELLECS